MILLELQELVDLAQAMLIVELRCGRVTRPTAPEPIAVAVLIRRRDLLFGTVQSFSLRIGQHSDVQIQEVERIADHISTGSAGGTEELSMPVVRTRTLF